jgi:hypothetical protein
MKYGHGPVFIAEYNLLKKFFIIQSPAVSLSLLPNCLTEQSGRTEDQNND